MLMCSLKLESTILSLEHLLKLQSPFTNGEINSTNLLEEPNSPIVSVVTGP
jgi:hypothetical protein